MFSKYLICDNEMPKIQGVQIAFKGNCMVLYTG